MIEENLYNTIIDVLPILCVDGFIFKDNKILLLKRSNYPAIGEWWVPGGRVFKNESLIDAMKRKIKEEINLEVINLNQIGITETIFDDKKHTVNICFLVECKDYNIEINNDHSNFEWFSVDSLPKLNQELKKIINYERTNK
jgi:colanic acid biosynthesis protein WcaH